VTLTFDLIFSGGRGIVIDYLCATFGDVSAVLVLSCGHHIQTESHTEADDRYTHVITVGVSNKFADKNS